MSETFLKSNCEHCGQAFEFAADQFNGEHSDMVECPSCQLFTKLQNVTAAPHTPPPPLPPTLPPSPTVVNKPEKQPKSVSEIICILCIIAFVGWTAFCGFGVAMGFWGVVEQERVSPGITSSNQYEKVGGTL